MNGSRLRALLIALAAGSACVAFLPAAASGERGKSDAAAQLPSGWVADQSYTGALNAVAALTAQGETRPWVAQTFTAGVTGHLMGVRLDINGCVLAGTQCSGATNTGDISVTVAPVNAAGRPDLNAKLGTADRVAGTPVAQIGGAPGEIIALFSQFSAAPPIIAGRQYAFVVSFANGQPGQFYFLWGAASDVYSRGSALGSSDGSNWGPLNTGSPPLFDLGFVTYAIPTFHLSVERAGSGSGSVRSITGAIDCGTSCSGDFQSGATVVLTATPDPGSRFTGWFGSACSGSSATCMFTLSADTTVTATFGKNASVTKARLSVHRIGPGTVSSRPVGINCGTRCSNLFLGAVTLVARPSAGAVFRRWGGACRGANLICRLRVTHATAVTAVFARK